MVEPHVAHKQGGVYLVRRSSSIYGKQRDLVWEDLSGDIRVFLYQWINHKGRYFASVRLDDEINIKDIDIAISLLRSAQEFERKSRPHWEKRGG